MSIDENDKAPTSVGDSLKKVAADFDVVGYLQNQTRNISKAFGMEYEIREASHDGIHSLMIGDFENAALCRKDMQAAWEELLKLHLPADIAWKHEAQAGQELAEYVFVELHYPMILQQDAEIPTLPSPEKLMVTPQAWLAGIGDGITELGRMTDHLLCNPDLIKEERIEIRKRYIKIATDVYGALDRQMGERVSEPIANNTRYRGGGYRKMLSRIRGTIRYHQQELISFYDRGVK